MSSDGGHANLPSDAASRDPCRSPSTGSDVSAQEPARDRHWEEAELTDLLGCVEAMRRPASEPPRPPTCRSLGGDPARGSASQGTGGIELKITCSPYYFPKVPPIAMFIPELANSKKPYRPRSLLDYYFEGEDDYQGI